MILPLIQFLSQNNNYITLLRLIQCVIVLEACACTVTVQACLHIVFSIKITAQYQLTLSNKQGSFITTVLSTASAAHSGALWRIHHTYMPVPTVPTGISLSPYSTYMQSYNLRSIVIPEILLDKKALVNHPISQSVTKLVHFDKPQPQLC